MFSLGTEKETVFFHNITLVCGIKRLSNVILVATLYYSLLFILMTACSKNESSKNSIKSFTEVLHHTVFFLLFLYNKILCQQNYYSDVMCTQDVSHDGRMLYTSHNYFKIP
jgi:hypothetical protein